MGSNWLDNTVQLWYLYWPCSVCSMWFWKVHYLTVFYIYLQNFHVQIMCFKKMCLLWFISLWHRETKYSMSAMSFLWWLAFGSTVIVYNMKCTFSCFQVMSLSYSMSGQNLVYYSSFVSLSPLVPLTVCHNVCIG